MKGVIIMFKTLKLMFTKREWSLAIDIDKGEEVGLVEFTGNVIDALKSVIELSKLK
jgi:hypothetical protein